MNTPRRASLPRLLFSLLLALPLAVGAQTPAPAASPTPAWITPASSVTTVNLTDIKGSAAATLKAGDKARVLGSDEDYYKVQLGDGPELYVLKKQVAPTTAPQVAPPPPVLLTGADKGSPVSAQGSTPEKSHFARNWGWYVGGLAVVGGAAAAAGGGGGGGGNAVTPDVVPDAGGNPGEPCNAVLRVSVIDGGARLIVRVTGGEPGANATISDTLLYAPGETYTKTLDGSGSTQYEVYNREGISGSGTITIQLIGSGCSKTLTRGYSLPNPSNKWQG